MKMEKVDSCSIKPLILRKHSFLKSTGWPVHWEGAATFGMLLICMVA